MNKNSELITKYLSGAATDQEVAELEEQLSRSTDLQDSYLEAVELDCLLKQESQDVSFDLSPQNEIEIQHTNIRRMIAKFSVGIAASLVVMISLINQQWLSGSKIISTTPSLGEVQYANPDSNSKLCLAASTGDIDSVKAELKTGANINFKNEVGLSALHLAAFHGHHNVVVHLIDQGADIHQIDYLGNTALHLSAFLGHWIIVEELLESGSNPEIRNQDGFNPDDLVALNWNPNLEEHYDSLAATFKIELDLAKIKEARPRIRETIGRFMTGQQDSNRRDITSWLVLSAARMFGQSLASPEKSYSPADLSKTGLARAAIEDSLLSRLLGNMMAQNSQPLPPTVSLIQAAKTGNIAAVQQHIVAGSNLNEKNDFDGCTPIILAAVFGKEDVVQKLLDAKADLTATNNQKNTALHAAAFFCQIHVVEMLLDAGIDLHAANDQGETAYDVAAKPMTEELRSVYQYIYGLLKIELNLKHIETDRVTIARLISAKISQNVDSRPSTD